MYVLLVNYQKPMEEVLKALEAHRIYLEKFYKSKNLLVSGRRTPATGGLIVADFKTRKDLETFIQGDPFFKEDIALYEVHEFTAAQHCQELAGFIERSV